MSTNNKNGNMDSLKRKYDSLKGWVGKNPVEKMGTVICVSTNNDGEYDVQFQADGKSTFLQLYEKYKNGGGGSGSESSVDEEEVKKILDEEVPDIIDDYCQEVMDEIEEDIEGIFFPKRVDSVAASFSVDGIILNAVGENIEQDDRMNWQIVFDGGNKVEKSSVGPSVILAGEDNDRYVGASHVTAVISIGSYVSGTINVK